jgi:hypothetical protein
MAPVLDTLPEALKDSTDGTTKIAVVRDVRIELREDAYDGRAFEITMVLADPPPGAETWPIEELWTIRRVARDIVANAMRENNIDLPWFVVFEPETIEPLASDDDES